MEDAQKRKSASAKDQRGFAPFLRQLPSSRWTNLKNEMKLKIVFRSKGGKEGAVRRREARRSRRSYRIGRSQRSFYFFFFSDVLVLLCFVRVRVVAWSCRPVCSQSVGGCRPSRTLTNLPLPFSLLLLCACVLIGLVQFKSSKRRGRSVRKRLKRNPSDWTWKHFVINSHWQLLLCPCGGGCRRRRLRGDRLLAAAWSHRRRRRRRSSDDGE